MLFGIYTEMSAVNRLRAFGNCELNSSDAIEDNATGLEQPHEALRVS